MEMWVYKFCQCMFAFTHGHKTKPKDMIPLMAAMHSEMWGQTKCRRGFHGHFHHEKTMSVTGGRVYGCGNLAPGDAWHIGAGYYSELEMSCQTYNSNGKTELIVPFEMHYDEIGCG